MLIRKDRKQTKKRPGLAHLKKSFLAVENDIIKYPRQMHSWSN